MRAVRLLAVLTVGLALLISGCSRFHHGQPKQPRTIYSALDATALVYSDPSVAAAVDDHPFRWVSFVLYPFGVATDYIINRPFYRMAAQSPATSGYSGEDAQLDLQRFPLIHGREKGPAPSR